MGRWTMAVALLLWPMAVMAQEPAKEAAANITSYPASFFADAHPNNANDMVARLEKLFADWPFKGRIPFSWQERQGT